MAEETSSNFFGSNILSLVSWAHTNLLRPILVLITSLLFFNLPLLLFRIQLTIRGWAYLLFCNDKTWKTPSDPDVYFKSVPEENIQRKTIIFVRHGESTWNDTFNMGKHRSALVFVLGFIPGLIKACLYEWYLILSGKIDSWFFDAPLSHFGLDQVEELSNFLSTKPHGNLTDKEAELITILRADVGAPPSAILCSSLRRALSTIAAAFRERLDRRPKDKILVLPSLQEISRNPDTLSITPAHTQVTASWIDRTSDLCNFQGIFDNQTDMSLHIGNKPIDTNGLKRMNEFCDFVFTSTKENNVIVGGHSIWFRYFFRTFLPYNVDHVSKKRKVVNCGCVAFTLMRTKTTKEGYKYMIDPKSIQIVYGGF